MPNRWLPITVLSLLIFGLGYAIVSLSVGEKGPHPIQIEGTGDVQELVGGIHQLDDRLGDDDAPISMTLFQDVQCPRCADFQADVIDPLINDYVRTGEAQINWRNFPLGLKPVTLGAIAVEAAAEQDHGWQYAELFMRNLDEVPEHGVDQEYLDQVASVTPKLDTAAWEDAYDAASPDSDAVASAQEDVDLATDLRLPADPILVIENPATGESETLEDVPSLEDVEAAIERLR
jgi:protein-disulfide isomerase